MPSWQQGTSNCVFKGPEENLSSFLLIWLYAKKLWVKANQFFFHLNLYCKEKQEGQKSETRQTLITENVSLAQNRIFYFHFKDIM